MAIKVYCSICGKPKMIYKKGRKGFVCCHTRQSIEANAEGWEEQRTPEEQKAHEEANKKVLVIEKPKVDPKPQEEEKRDLSEVYRYQCGKCGSYFDDYDEDEDYFYCPNKKCRAILGVKNGD